LIVDLSTIILVDPKILCYNIDYCGLDIVCYSAIGAGRAKYAIDQLGLQAYIEDIITYYPTSARWAGLSYFNGPIPLHEYRQIKKLLRLGLT